MRTAVLLGLAAGSVLLAGRASAAEMPMIDSQAGTHLVASAHFGHDNRPRLDYGAPSAPDARVYTGYPDRVPSEFDYRRVEGSYDAEGRWTGTWNGSYEAPDGRRYDGSYEGTVEGRPGTSYAPPADDSYPDGAVYRGGPDPRYDADMERRCGRGGTAGGAVVGGLVGGIAGNRIAGRGNRTAGTVIGGALGAVAGAAIGDAADRQRCESWWASRQTYHHGGGHFEQGGYPPAPYYGGQGGTTVYQHGGYAVPYGYYTPGVIVTTVITTGAPVVTETVETTTSTRYVNVPVRKRHVAKKRTWKPKKKIRCVC